MLFGEEWGVVYCLLLHPLLSSLVQSSPVLFLSRQNSVRAHKMQEERIARISHRIVYAYQPAPSKTVVFDEARPALFDEPQPLVVDEPQLQSVVFGDEAQPLVVDEPEPPTFEEAQSQPVVVEDLSSFLLYIS